MGYKKCVAAAAATCAAALTLTACTPPNEQAGSSSSSNLTGQLVGVGASSQGSAQEAWIAELQKQHPKLTINYDPAGSGTGREAFANGASAFAGSDRAFNTAEIESNSFDSCTPDSELIEFPAYISPIAIIFNLPGITSLNLDAPTIANIFNGTIKTWNDPAIAAQNPGVSLPDTPIKPVHRSDKSGTTDNFTDYLASAAAEQWAAGKVEEWPREYGGEGAQGTSGVVSAVKNGAGTIGYADASRAADLGIVALKVGEQHVSYTPAAAAAIVDISPQAPRRAPSDLVIDIDRDTAQPGVYPLVLVSYLIGCAEYKDSKQADLAKTYFQHVASVEGQQAAQSHAGSAPLSAGLQNRVSSIVAEIR